MFKKYIRFSLYHFTNKKEANFPFSFKGLNCSFKILWSSDQNISKINHFKKFWIT